METLGFAAFEEKGKLKPVKFERTGARDFEVELKITNCGVCHSDVHNVDNDWGNTDYPTVPGHEIVGEVTKTGSKVEKFKVGDRIGVGCMIDSCGECEKCKANLENYCQGKYGMTLTYGGTQGETDVRTYGGYSTNLVVQESFGITIPKKLESKYVGPIMCAGITVYSPMKRWELKKGDKLGVVGIGGLGHMAIKIGKALGAEVTAFTRSEDKVKKIKEMGADHVVVSKNDSQMEKAANSLDLMINTIPVSFDISTYLPLMKHDSTIVIVGNLEKLEEFPTAEMVFKRVSIAGSVIGGIKETQEVIDLCAEHDIRPEIKEIEMGDINQVFEDLRKGKSDNFRHVIDMHSMEKFMNDKSVKTIDNPKRYPDN